MNKVMFKNGLLILLSVGSLLCADNITRTLGTIWTDTSVWITAAEQHGIATGLIQVIQQIQNTDGCKGAFNNPAAQDCARQLMAYIQEIINVRSKGQSPEFQEHAIKRTLAAGTRLQALRHFCPDFNIPTDQAVWNGSLADAAAAFLEINQELDVERATPYIQGLLILVTIGY